MSRRVESPQESSKTKTSGLVEDHSRSFQYSCFEDSVSVQVDKICRLLIGIPVVYDTVVSTRSRVSFVVAVMGAQHAQYKCNRGEANHSSRSGPIVRTVSY